MGINEEPGWVDGGKGGLCHHDGKLSKIRAGGHGAILVRVGGGGGGGNDGDGRNGSAAGSLCEC